MGDTHAGPGSELVLWISRIACGWTPTVFRPGAGQGLSGGRDVTGPQSPLTTRLARGADHRDAVAGPRSDLPMSGSVSHPPLGLSVRSFEVPIHFLVRANNRFIALTYLMDTLRRGEVPGRQFPGLAVEGWAPEAFRDKRVAGYRAAEDSSVLQTRWPLGTSRRRWRDRSEIENGPEGDMPAICGCTLAVAVCGLPKGHEGPTHQTTSSWPAGFTLDSGPAA